MTKIKRVEKDIRTIFEEKMQSGDMVPVVGLYFTSTMVADRCGCLFGMMFGYTDKDIRGAGPATLSITEKQVVHLEAGFEGRESSGAVGEYEINDPYYKLGARIRRHYT